MIRLTRASLAVGVILALTSPAAPAQESWDAIYLGGSKVGHTHVTIEPVKDKAGRSLVRVRVDWDLTFRRGKNHARMKLMYGTIETPDGEVIRLDTRTHAAQNDDRTYGDVKDGAMVLIHENGGNRQQERIAWGPEVRGPYGSELSLSRKPIAPGEAREVKTYIPDLNKVCVTRLVAKDKEPVPIGQAGEKRELLRVEQAVLGEDGKPLPGMTSTLWIDASGQILKSHTDLFGGMETFRTTKAGALAEGNDRFDLMAHAVLRVKDIPDPEKSRQIVYRVTSTDDDLASVFPNDRRQEYTPGTVKGTGTLTVRMARINDGLADGAEPDPEFLRPNPLVNSDDPRVVRLMKSATKGVRADDPWAKSVAIEDWVATNIKDKNFSTAFASAAEVAKNLQGDCSEHSVLVAAMCRAAGVPARCVVGVVYSPNLGGFGPHMWNEVFVNGRWVAIDAAFHQSEVDATHLKLSATSLDGVAPFQAFLPVLKVFGPLSLEPIEIR